MSSVAAASKASPFLVSRRALQRLKQKYPQYLVEPVQKSKPKKDNSTWPRSMQIAGYTAVALSIPYSIIIVVAESPRLRDYLEGDPMLSSDNNDEGSSVTAVTYGQSFVNFVRYYWGHEDHIPYSDYLENINHEEVSLESDVNTVDRRKEAGIQVRIHDDIRLRVEGLGLGESNDDVEYEGTLPGDVVLSNMDIIRKGVGMKVEDGTGHGVGGEKAALVLPAFMSFEDPAPSEQNDATSIEESGSSTTISFSDTTIDGDSVSSSPSFETTEDNVKSLSSYVQIWSAWHAFGANIGGSTTDDKSTAGASTHSISMSREQIEVEEVRHKIEELQRDLSDPRCTRDIDDMNAELLDLRRRYRALWKVRGVAKLKNIFGTS